jgi:hypothetical protein
VRARYSLPDLSMYEKIDGNLNFVSSLTGYFKALSLTASSSYL